MRCPFCHASLIMSSSDYNTTYHCDDGYCLINNEMPRYIVSYQNTYQKPSSKTFCLENLYVQVDFVNDVTIISRLDVVILLDQVRIPKAINFNLCDAKSTLNKLKLMVTFS